MRRNKSDKFKDPPISQRSASNQLESIADSNWNELSERASILRSAGKGPLTRAQAHRLAKRLSVHWTTVYRWRRRLDQTDLVTSLKDLERGSPVGTKRALSHYFVKPKRTRGSTAIRHE